MKERRWWQITSGLLVILLLVWLAPLPAIILIVGLLVALLIIWFLLAPNNTIWSFVPEGTAKIVVRGESFVKAFIQWAGYTFDKDWNVISEDATHKEPRHFGGIRFNGIPLLDIIFSYNLRWKSVRQSKEGTEVKFHEETLDYVPLKPEVYFTKIFAAETEPPERIPLDIEWLVTIRVTNPYRVLFVAPHNWVENTLNRLNALFMSWVGTKTLDEILEIKENPEQLWQEVGEHELVQKTLEGEWGVKVELSGIQMGRIDLPSDFQDAAAQEKKQKLQAAGRSAETVGTVLAMMAHSRGVTIGEIQEEIQGNPEKQKEFLEIAKDLVKRKIAIEGGSFVDIRVEGAEGLEASLLNLVTAWHRMPKGKSPKIKNSEVK